MKNRRTVFLCFLLAAGLTLGIGYASLSDTLTIGGTASLTEEEAQNTYNEDIYFSNVISGTKCNAVITDDNDVGYITVTANALKSVGDEAIATYTVKSESDLDTVIAAPVITNDQAEFFKVSTNWDGNETDLAAGATADIVVTVKLIKTPDADVACTFNIQLGATSVD